MRVHEESVYHGMKEVIDVILIQFKDKIKSIAALKDSFSVLNYKYLKSLNDKELKTCVINLASKYLEGDEFPTEILALHNQLQNSFLSCHQMNPLDFLNLIQGGDFIDPFPNVSISL